MIARLLATIFFLSIVCMLPAQPFCWMPVAEDTIFYAREYLPDRRMISPEGPAQQWDFRTLKAPYAIPRRVMVTNGRDDKKFASLINGTQTDAILQVDNRGVQILQVLDENPVCKGNRLTYTLTPAYKPLSIQVMGEQSNYRGKMVCVFAWPRNSACQWDPPQIPDSCRVTYTIAEDLVVDASGTLYLPTEVSDAVRQKITVKRAIRIEVKYGLLWRDVTSLVPGIRYLETYNVYRFVSPTSDLQLAEIQLDEDANPTSIEFKTHPLVTRIVSEEPGRPDIFAYPNPSYDVVRFQLCDLSKGKYKLRLFNILGVMVRETDIDVDDNRKTITMDLGDLQRGTYLYRLQDSSGRTIKTKRVILIQA